MVEQGATYPSVMAIWQKWAPPSERTRLLAVTFSGESKLIVLCDDRVFKRKNSLIRVVMQCTSEILSSRVCGNWLVVVKALIRKYE